MANNSENCGCGNGKTFLVDPNNNLGEDSADGFSVPLEDLNIYVELTTTRKSRSVIDVSDSATEFDSTVNDAGTISFIAGSDNGEVDADGDPKQSLTTKFTELTTVFNKEKDTENLGIENIDIKFNSSYAPLVTIKFIDLRGSALFNTINEEGQPESPYKVFFELPYPIFQLTIKGYYGKPVRYCLHLTKFTSKFNTTTGNFEIICDFIGYTYALLTDLLLGYLRAITKTPRGLEKFQKIQDEMKDGDKDSLITLNELIIRADNIHEELDKLKVDDENVKKLSKVKNVKTNLEDLTETVDRHISKLTKDDLTNNAVSDGVLRLRGGNNGFIIIPSETSTNSNSETQQPTDIVPYLTSKSPTKQAILKNRSEDGTEIKAAGQSIIAEKITKYKEEVEFKVNSINENLTSENLNVEDFNNPYVFMSFSLIDYVGEDSNNVLIQNFKNVLNLDTSDNSTEYEELINALSATIGDRNNETKYDLVDFSKIKQNIVDRQISLDESEENLKLIVGKSLSNVVNKILGFNPTIRNIFRIFTVHSEIFLECIKETSELAENSDLRRTELLTLGDKAFDDQPSENTEAGNPNAQVGALPEKIYPWPLYREESKTISKSGVYDEAWLGNKIQNKENIPEIVFVEELLRGLLAVNREDRLREQGQEDETANWYPISPMDTPLFGVTRNPYVPIEGSETGTKSIGDSPNLLDPLKVAMMRAFIFMGINNRSLIGDEIKTMGLLEANTANIGIPNQIIKTAIANDFGQNPSVAADNIIEIFRNGTDGKGNSVTIKGADAESATTKSFMTKDGDDYRYTFIDDTIAASIEKPNKFIPINGQFDGNEFFKSDGSVESNPNIVKSSSYVENQDKRGAVTNNGTIFLSSDSEYASDYGAVFFKIFDDNTYNTANELIPDYPTGSEKIKELNKNIDDLHNGTTYLDLDTLTSKNKNGESEPHGWRILGSEKNKNTYIFNTIKQLNYTGKDSKIYNGGKEGGLARTVFYSDVNLGGNGINLSKVTSQTTFNLDKTINIGGTDRYQLTNRKITRPRIISEITRTGQNRELFADGINHTNSIAINNIDFSVTNSSTLLNSLYPLFGSRLYFEQRRSSSPKAARALLFLHTFPWNNLFNRDDRDDGFEGTPFNSYNNNLFDNIFGRKAAFINCPKLWPAFIGGVLWREDTDNIIFEDDPNIDEDNVDLSKQVPTYKGGSGTFDPLIWGEKIIQGSSKSLFFSEEEITISGITIEEKSGYIPTINSDDPDDYPSRDSYLTVNNGPLRFSKNSDDYRKISSILLNLPKQIKEEFKKAFFDFVNSNEWRDIRRNLEIVPKDWSDSSKISYGVNGYTLGSFEDGFTFNSEDWKNLWIKTSSSEGANDSDKNYMDISVSKEGKNSQNGTITGFIKKEIIENDFQGIISNKNNYESFAPLRNVGVINTNASKGGSFETKGISNVTTAYNYDMKYRSGTAINQTLVRLFVEGSWIANASYKPWVSSDAGSVSDERGDIIVKEDDLKLYLTSFMEEFRRLNDSDVVTKKEDEDKQALFNTMDDDTIRLNIYRHCKSINDKWIAGTGKELIFTCKGKRASRDVIEAEKENRTTPRLIDSFRFVNRAFNDIGNDFLINPGIIAEIMMGNNNQSMYDLIGRVLADNNFEFVSLPAFIDYTSMEAVCDVFKPQIISDELVDGTSGPSFVCVYVGQTSNKLDLGRGNDFPNDGFDFKCDPDNPSELMGSALPNDFISSDDDDQKVAAFAINYGHQNQSIFTDIKLDQQEFSETDESLRITDSIANSAGQSNRTLAGQNLWNVYQVRSYSTEVTMMGNAMIQPMMYFQLNNIPMFHGAYLIIEANHNIQPNHMKTTFRGVRIRFVDTPLLDANTLYMSMLGSLSDVDATDALLNISPVQYAKFITYQVPNGVNHIAHQRPKIAGYSNYMMTETGKFIQEAAQKYYNETNGIKSYGDTFFVNDMSRLNGQTWPNNEHTTHREGRSIDIRMADVSQSHVRTSPRIMTWNGSGKEFYSREGTIHMIETLINLGNEPKWVKAGVRVERIYFNDPQVAERFGDIVNVDERNRGVYHDNHMHVKLSVPTRILNDLTADSDIAGDFNPDMDGQKDIAKIPQSDMPSSNKAKEAIGKV